MQLQIPTVTIVSLFHLTASIALIHQGDLLAFHAKHFPNAPKPEHVLHRVFEEAAEESYEEEDDGLGYYPDGSKRTLTDEQIAMFRHSEIQAVLRKRRLQRERTDTGELSEEGEAEDDTKDATHDSASPASTSTNTAQPKAHQWATSSARTKAKNKKNRDKYKIKKRGIRLQRERERSEHHRLEEQDDQSDEWDPWHQANGPDVQKEEALELDY